VLELEAIPVLLLELEAMPVLDATPVLELEEEVVVEVCTLKFNLGP
jgi:hypothetical protein